MKKYDLVVVGSGSGLMLAEAALSQGLRCAIVEKSKFGGTCLTKGCIPSKMLVYPADLIREAEETGRIGLSFGAPDVDWGRISERMWAQIGHSEGIRSSLKRVEGLDVYEGAGEFTGDKTMRVRYADGSFSEDFSADRFVIAAGARSFVPPVDGLSEAGYVTSETFFGDQFPKSPWKSLIVIGGGAIGAEFAHIFSAFGAKVSVVEMKPHLVSTEEEEISVFVEKQFHHHGIDVLTGVKVVSARRLGDLKAVTVEDVTSGERREITAEEIFVASGVRSNGDLMALDKAGIKTDARGWIEVDEFLETNQPGIYAIGDINGKYQFRHKANYEADILIGNLFGGEHKKASYNAVPWAIFTWPQVGHAGMTEREIKEKGLAYGVARNHYSSVAAGISMGLSEASEDNGFAKILLSPEGRILGAHVVGPYASMLVQPFVYLINAGCPCQSAAQAPGLTGEARKALSAVCSEFGSVRPISDSMVIHPSMNELTAWAIEDVEWAK